MRPGARTHVHNTIDLLHPKFTTRLSALELVNIQCHFFKWFLCAYYWPDVHWHWSNNNTCSMMHVSIDGACPSNGYYYYYYCYYYYYGFYCYCVYDNDTDSSRMRMYPIRRYQCDSGYCYCSSTLIPSIHGHTDDLAYDWHCYCIGSYYRLGDRAQLLCHWWHSKSIDLSAIAPTAHWIADDCYCYY